MPTRFLKFSKLILITIFLVIIAGAVVRTTQSGMGCPDWPKCFGRWVPPTNENQLPANYKEIYAFKYVDTSFNVYHTWTEYVNRLLGASLGLLIFIQTIWSATLFKKNRKIFFYSILLLVLTGFQGWLGKKVVDANLASLKITIHLIGALVLVWVSIMQIIELQNKPKVHIPKVKAITLLTLLLLLFQFFLGTEVRGQIDEISLQLNFNNREHWIGLLDYKFYIHRSFSILMAIACIYLFTTLKWAKGITVEKNVIIGSVIAEILVGIILSYANMPAFAQPLHLLVACVLFAGLVSLLGKLTSNH